MVVHFFDEGVRCNKTRCGLNWQRMDIEVTHEVDDVTCKRCKRVIKGGFPK